MDKLTAYLENKIWYMLLFTVAVLPLRQELTTFCLAVTFLAAMLVRYKRGSQLQPCVLRRWQQWALYALLAVAAVSVYFSLDRTWSFLNLLYVVGQDAALFYLVLRYGAQGSSSITPAGTAANGRAASGGWSLQLPWRRFDSLPRPLQLLLAVLAVSLVVSAIGIAQKALGIQAEGVWVDPKLFPDLKVRAFSTLYNPNILAGYLVLIIGYCAAFFSVTKAYRRLRLAFLTTGFLAALCLLYTYSRGNWLACAVMLLAFCVLFCRKAFIPVLGGGALALAVGGRAVLQRLESIHSGYSGDTSIALRMAYLKSTKWIIEEFPWGVGWCGYRFVYPTYNFYLADESVIMYHCHNIFLNVLAELGWHGLAVFLLVWWGIFLPAGWRLACSGRQLWQVALGRGYVLATVGIAIGGLTDHVYFSLQMSLLFWFLGALTMVAAQMNTKK